MILRFVTSLRSTIASAIIAAIDAGGGAATIAFYTDDIPAVLGSALTTQVLLGTLTCSDPCATENEGEIAFSAITQDSGADATGTAAWVYIKDSTGAVVAAGDVTDNAGDGFVKVNTTAIVAGGPIAMTSLTITVGGA